MLYDYQASRSGSCAVNYLKGYNGILQADGYAGYAQVDATFIGCMAHARRKFVEAQTGQPKNKTGRADWAIRHIKKLYLIERTIKGLSTQEKLTIRQEKSLPLLKAFKIWRDKSAQQVLPKSAISNAIRYTINQWDKLIGYVENGDIQINNNRA